jgi:hypothetical protein
MALYLARYLNVPPARIPGDSGDEQSNDLPTDARRLMRGGELHQEAAP